MELTKADVRNYQELYLRHFDEKISDKMALIKLSLLVRQMEIIYQPISKEQLLKMKNGDENERGTPATHK